MASDQPKNDSYQDREERVSLYPLSPEEALKRALSTQPPRKEDGGNGQSTQDK
ncbi:MAG: hypothetical protein GXP26_17890 [Planctomycetes bacterium]|nr:hypothetical protein [Planctomycetota bacterium]